MLTLVGAALVTTCSESPTGPARPRLATLRMAPSFDSYARFAPLTLDNVRIAVSRPPGDTIARAATSFNSSANQVQLSVQVPLQSSSEDLDVLLELYAGTVRLFTGAQTVHVTSGAATAPQSVPVSYTGPGTQAVSIAIAPRDSTVSFGATVPYRVSALDGNGQAVAQFYVSWSIPSPPSGAAIDPTGQFTAPGGRDTLLLVAATPNGLADTTSVIVVAPPGALAKAGGDHQTGGPGGRLPLPLEAAVTGTDGLPVPGVLVSFTAPAGGSVDSATATTDGQGVARTGAVLATTVGPQTFTASAAGLTAVNFTETATGSVTWTGAVSSDWSVAGNWNPAQVPTNASDVAIPAGTPHDPGLTASGSARTLTVQTGAVLNLNGINFQAGGNVFADGAIVGPGAVQIAIAAQVRGNLPDLIVSGPVALAGTAQIQNLTVSNGDFALGGHGAAVSGNLATQGSGTITMTNAADALSVVGNATFGGGSTAGKLTAGLLILEGPAFTQSGGASSFAASGSHRTNIARGAAATLTFSDPVNSGFQDLNITGMTAGVTLQSDVRVGGQLIAGAGAGAALINTSATPHTLTVAGVNVDGLQVDRAPLVIQGGTITQFDNVQFTNSTTTGAQLSISHPGAAAPFSFNNLSFGTTPVAPNGFYLDATDANPADGLSLVINLVNPTPPTGGSFVTTAGGATVNWPASAPVLTWTGALSTDWATAGNWSPAQVPVATDAVTIAPATNQPVIATGVVAASLTVQAGATLTVDGGLGGTLALTGTLTVDGALTGTNAQVSAAGSITAPAGSQLQLFSLVVGGGLSVQGSYAVGTTGFTGSGQTIPPLPYTDILVTGTAQLLPGTIYPPARNVSVTGQLTLNGSSLVVAGGFQTSGAGTLVMTQASDLLRVLGPTAFAGGSTAGLLTAGQTDFRGDFFQAGDPQAFAPSGAHLTALNLTAPHAVAFTNPSPTQSHFQGLDLSAAAGAITLGSDVEVSGTLTATPSAGPPSIGAGAQLFAIRTAGINVTGLTLDDATLTVDGGPITSLKGVTFQNTPTTATALTVRHPGPGGPFALSGLTFAVPPTTGFYLRADDSNTGDGVPLTLDVTGSSPAAGAPFFQAVNGAVVNWPPTTTTTWTGGAGTTDWFTAANWSTNTVPGTTDSVIIQASTTSPVLTAAVTVGAVDIQSGTLTLNGHALTVTRTFLTGGTGRLVMTNAADLLSAGNVVFAGGDETGFLTAGVLEVGADFAQLSTNSANSFVASGTHLTRLINADKQVSMASGSSTFNDLELNTAGTATVVGQIQVARDLSLTGGGTLTGNTVAGVRNVSVVAGTFLTVQFLEVGGTISSTGQFAPGTVIFSNPAGGTIPASGANVTYGSIGVGPSGAGGAAFTLGGPVSASGALTLWSELIPAGNALSVGGDFVTSGPAGMLTMTNPLDTVTVGGAVFFGGGDETGHLTAGTLVTSGQFIQDGTNSATSFVASGTHTVALTTVGPGGNAVNFANPGTSHFQNLRALVISDITSDLTVNGDMEVNFNLANNMFARHLTVGGTLTKDGIGFFGPTRLTLLGGFSFLGGTFSADTTEFAGATPQSMPGDPNAFYGTVFVKNDVTVTLGLPNIGGDLEISGNGRLQAGAFGAAVGGSLRTLGQGTLVQVDPASVITVGGDAVFDGGDEVDLITGGRLEVSGNFSQLATNSTSSFAAFPGHQVLFKNPSPTITFTTPATSVFGDLEIASGGVVTLGSAVSVGGLVDGNSGGFNGAYTGTFQSAVGTVGLFATGFWSGGTTMDGVVLSLNDPGGTQASLDGVTFKNVATSATQLTLAHPGPSFSMTNMNFMPLTPGDSGLYLDVSDSDGRSPAVLSVTVSHDPDPAGGVSRGAVWFKTDGVAQVTWQP